MEELFEKLRGMQKKAGISVAALLLSLVALVITFKLAGAFGFIFVGTALIAGIFAVRTNKAYTACYKENVVRTVLGEVFDDLIFEPGNGIDEDTVYGTGMVQVGDRFSSNDLIAGTYHGVRFRQSDVHIEEETHDSDGNTSTSTLFRGRWIMLEFNKTFRADMQVISKHFFASKRKGGLFTKKENKLNKIELENETFNKEFRVFAQDQQEAFYILTPHMMEALMRLREGVKAPIMLMFVGGTLHVAVENNKDAFEAKIFGKLDPEQERQRILGDIRIITAFADEMELDRDIYQY